MFCCLHLLGSCILKNYLGALRPSHGNLRRAEVRPYVAPFDTNAVSWQDTGVPGLYTKLLSRDPHLGARTALQCIDTYRGYEPPKVAHYHHIDEELFVVKGTFSFDGTTWLKPGSYCFHPAETVHGFRSTIDGEAWFISRCSRELDFNFVERPEKNYPYSLSKNPPHRSISVLPEPRTHHGWEKVYDQRGNVVLERLILNQDLETGEGSMLVQFLPGWGSPHGDHFHTVYEEIYVVEGHLLSENGIGLEAGWYTFKPPGTLQPRPFSPDGALAYINFGGQLDFRPAHELDTFLGK